jgi:hypothetical protein
LHAWHNGDIIYNRFLELLLLLLLFQYVPIKRTSKIFISVFTLDGQGFFGSLFMKSDLGWVILVIIEVFPLDLPAMIY